MLALSGTVVLVPVLTSLLSPESASPARHLSSLQLISRRGGSGTTRSATTTTSARPGGIDVDRLLAVSSPFFAPPAPPVPPPPVVVPAVAPAPPGPPMPPPANKASRRRSQKGLASWYQIDDGTCAHVSLPKGTMVRVVNLENKKEIVCRVADRGPFLDGRVIDLDVDDFKRLAERTEGLIEVRINW